MGGEPLVAHLLAYSAQGKVPGCSPDTPEVLAVVEVPGGGMAHYLPPISRLLQHRPVPERGGHRKQPQGGEEFVCFLKHPSGCPALQAQDPLPNLKTVRTECVLLGGRDWEKATLEGTPESEVPLPLGRASLP